jgi:hypothetical protein
VAAAARQKSSIAGRPATLRHRGAICAGSSGVAAALFTSRGVPNATPPEHLRDLRGRCTRSALWVYGGRVSQLSRCGLGRGINVGVGHTTRHDTTQLWCQQGSI